MEDRGSATLGSARGAGRAGALLLSGSPGVPPASSKEAKAKPVLPPTSVPGCPEGVEEAAFL